MVKQKQDLHQGLKELHDELNTVEMPAGSYARLQERFQTRSDGRISRSVLQWAVTSATIGLLLVIGFFLWQPAPQEVAGFLLIDEHSTLSWQTLSDGGIEITEGQGTLEAQDLGTQLMVQSGSRLRKEEKAIRVVRGRIGFTVAKRSPRSEPVIIEVSHGTIRVLGTRFTVVQGDGGGQVTLESGKIRFVSDHRRIVVMRPGQTLRWPLEEDLSTDTEDPTPPIATSEDAEKPANAPVVPKIKKSRRPRLPVKIEDSEKPALEPKSASEKLTYLAPDMAKLEKLRIRKQFPALVGRIRTLLPRVKDRGLKESLSYELCDILIYKIKDQEQACKQMATHLRTFRGGRYEKIIQQAIRNLGCRNP